MTAAGRDAPPHLGALYPFLYAAPASSAADRLTAALAASTAAKLCDAAAVRARTLAEQAGALAACARDLAAALAAGGRILAFGNGGSATDAQACAELFADPPPGHGAPPLAAYPLSADTAVLSALANDVGVEAVFARQVAAHGRPGDIAIGFSTSGNSPNLVAAFGQARTSGLLTVGFTGGGGLLAEPGAVDHLFTVRSPSVHRIQEAQTTVCHVLWELTVAELGGGADSRSRAAQGVYADDRDEAERS